MPHMRTALLVQSRCTHPHYRASYYLKLFLFSKSYKINSVRYDYVSFDIHMLHDVLLAASLFIYWIQRRENTHTWRRSE